MYNIRKYSIDKNQSTINLMINYVLLHGIRVSANSKCI